MSAINTKQRICYVALTEEEAFALVDLFKLARDSSLTPTVQESAVFAHINQKLLSWPLIEERLLMAIHK